MKKKYGIFLLALLIACICIFTSCGKTKQKASNIFAVKDLEGTKIGVQLGTTGDIYASDYENDDAGTVVERYNKGNDAIQALKQGKIDSVIIDEQPAKSYVEANRDLSILDEVFADEEYAICISKGNSDLKNKINQALEELKADGTINAIIQAYIGGKEEETEGSAYHSPSSVSRTNGKLTVVTNAYFKPYEYYENGKIVGIDADIIQAICDKLGMELELSSIEFDSIITAVQSGKADIGISGMTITEERLKNIDFTESYTTARQVIVVRNGTASAGENIKTQLYDNFLKEGRWKYLVNGLVNTIMITVLAVIIGVVIGFLIAVIRSCYDKNGSLKILNGICKIYLTIIRGTPSMLQLLIIYYIVFASVNINKIFVAVVAFGLNSAAYVAEIVRSGIMSIDNGQFEAGRSLGLNFRKTMSYIIIPQAFKNVLPALGNEAIVLLKETSICGYIGLSELTRGGDVIRSITYSAFMPLMAVALIYLIMVMFLEKGVAKLERRLRNNERR